MTTTEPTVTYTPVTLIWPAGEDIADIEATDAVIISDRLESVDIGSGLLGHAYLRITGPDLVAAADELRRLADRITDVVLEARQERIDAESHACYCGTRLDADEQTCGSTFCETYALMDAQL